MGQGPRFVPERRDQVLPRAMGAHSISPSPTGRSEQADHFKVLSLHRPSSGLRNQFWTTCDGCAQAHCGIEIRQCTVPVIRLPSLKCVCDEDVMNLTSAKLSEHCRCEITERRCLRDVALPGDLTGRGRQ